MRNFLRQLFLVLILISISSCSHSRSITTNSRHANVPLARVPGDAKVLTNILSAFMKAGIPVFADGSSMYVVSVPADKKSQATEVLKKDAEVNKYEVIFY